MDDQLTDATSQLRPDRRGISRRWIGVVWCVASSSCCAQPRVRYPMRRSETASDPHECEPHPTRSVARTRRIINTVESGTSQLQVRAVDGREERLESAELEVMPLVEGSNFGGVGRPWIAACSRPVTKPNSCSDKRACNRSRSIWLCCS